MPRWSEFVFQSRAPYFLPRFEGLPRIRLPSPTHSSCLAVGRQEPGKNSQAVDLLRAHLCPPEIFGFRLTARTSNNGHSLSETREKVWLIEDLRCPRAFCVFPPRVFCDSTDTCGCARALVACCRGRRLSSLILFVLFYLSFALCSGGSRVFLCTSCVLVSRGVLPRCCAG